MHSCGEQSKYSANTSSLSKHQTSLTELSMKHLIIKLRQGNVATSAGRGTTKVGRCRPGNSNGSPDSASPPPNA